MLRTFNEKFGDTETGEGGWQKGLARYERLMRDIMADPKKNKDDKEFLKLSKKLRNFIDGQQEKLDDAKKALETKQNVGDVKYGPGTASFVEQLESEQKIMNEIRGSLGARYKAWAGLGGRTVSKAVDDEYADVAS